MTTIETTNEITCVLEASLANDLDMVNAARVSLDVAHEVLELGDAELIDWLMRKHHGSPFEHGYFRFHVEIPIFVIREHHRHRVGHSYNEMSGRYTVMPGRFYLPATARTQQGKPGAYTFTESAKDSSETYRMQRRLRDSYETAWRAYEDALENGVAKEQARVCLPVAIYTKQKWSTNPRALMHFLGLRTAPDAMREIRTMANLAEAAFAEQMPITHAAWVANGRVAP